MSKFSIWETTRPGAWFSCVPGKNGFLPVSNPLQKLPHPYEIINDLLEDMKINNGGDLSKGIFHKKVYATLPIFDFESVTDVRLLAALQRDYCFLASAFCFEPCHLSMTESGKGVYGKAREELPPQIAIPLVQLSRKNETFPWLDYAYGYGLNNACVKEGKDPTLFDSYDSIRLFNGNESEKGFINVHVAMVSQSGKLLECQQKCLDSVSRKDRKTFNLHFQSHYEIFQNIISTLQTMWKASRNSEYLTFRTFIMGHIGNKECFPKESVLYKGVNETKSFRGETGAQDSIIPSIDSFLDLEYPCNDLTRYLFDLRRYRPKDHQAYIEFTAKASKCLDFKSYCLDDVESSLILLKNLNCLRMFRKKHWNLTKKYIMENTKHPVATGGTPITTWLPNQLGATLEYMQLVIYSIKESMVPLDQQDFFKTLKIEISDHIQTVMDEVQSLQPQFSRQEHESFLNNKLQDSFFNNKLQDSFYITRSHES